jgi:hypothetical protein
MKTKRGLLVIAFLSLTLHRGQDQAQAQRAAREDETVIVPPHIVPYTNYADLGVRQGQGGVRQGQGGVRQGQSGVRQGQDDASPEELDVATRIDQLRSRVSSTDPLQRKAGECKLRDAVEEQFDLRQARLGRELNALRDEVSELETLVSERPAGRAKAIARGLRRSVMEAEWPGDESRSDQRAVPDGKGGTRLVVAQSQTTLPKPVLTPEERDLARRIERLGRQVGTAAEGERAEIEKRLRDALGEQFDLRQVRLARGLAALREEVQELDELVKKRRDGRDEAVARRLRSLGVGRN